MKVNKRILIAIVLVIAIVLGMTTQVSAVGENVTATVTTTPGNGGTVKPGDEITYTITMKDTSDAGYLFPTLITQVPEGTEYVSCTASAMATGVENPAVDTETGIITCIGDSIHPNSDIVFTLKVRVSETATGNINFANVTLDSEDTPGIAMYMVFATANVQEIDQAYKNLDSEAFLNATTLEEAQAALGENVYITIVNQPQTLTVSKEGEETTNPGTNPGTEQETEKTEQGTEQEKQEETTNTSKEPVVEGEKPTELPKTGRDFSTVIIATATLMIIAGIVIVMKKQSK